MTLWTSECEFEISVGLLIIRTLLVSRVESSDKVGSL